MHRFSGHGPIKSLVLFGIALIVVPALILWAWNITLPEIFGVPGIDYRNAFGLLVLGLTLGQLVRAPYHIRRTGPAGRSLHTGTGETK